MTQFLIVTTFRIKFGAKQVYSAWFDYRFDYLLETSVCRLDVISTEIVSIWDGLYENALIVPILRHGISWSVSWSEAVCSIKVLLDFLHKFGIAQNINSSHGHRLACNQSSLVGNLRYCCWSKCMRMIHSVAANTVHYVDWRDYLGDISHVCWATQFFLWRIERYPQGHDISLIEICQCVICIQTGVTFWIPFNRHRAS